MVHLSLLADEIIKRKTAKANGVVAAAVRPFVPAADVSHPVLWSTNLAFFIQIPSLMGLYQHPHTSCS